MKTPLNSLLFTVLLFVLFKTNVLAQWTEIPQVFGAYIYDNLEVHDGAVYVSFYTDSKIALTSTQDYINWELVAEQPANSQFGASRFLADGNSLFLTGWNIGQETASAYRSEDDGDTWTPFDLPAPAPYLYVATGGALHCATETTVYRSADNGANWAAVLDVASKTFDLKAFGSQGLLLTTVDSIFRSFDNGVSWQGDPAPYDASGVNFPVLTIYPTSHGLFVELDNGSTSTLFRSLDDGESWISLIVPSMYSNSNVNDLHSVGDLLWGVFDGRAAFSSDNGESWDFVVTPDGSLQLAVMGDTLFVGGSNGFYKSYDQAASWLSGNLGWEGTGIPISSFFSGEYLHASEGKLYQSTGDGLFTTANDGIEWQLRNNEGRFNNRYSSGDTTVFLGDGTLLSLNGEEDWEYIESDIFNYQFLFAQVGNYLFATSWFVEDMYRSEDWGISWTPLPMDAFFLDGMASDGSALYLLDHDDILVSNDLGQNFSVFNNGLGNNTGIDGIWGVEGRVFVMVDGQLWRREGNQWKPASVGLFDVNGNVPFIRSMSGAGDTVFISGVDQATYYPLFYLSTDGGKTWEGGWEEGLPLLSQHQAFLDGGVIYVLGRKLGIGEYYSRIWKQELPPPNATVAAVRLAGALHPNPANRTTALSFPDGKIFNGTVSVSTFNGQLLWSEMVKGINKLDIPVGDLLPGVYLVNVSSLEGWMANEKLVVVK